MALTDAVVRQAKTTGKDYTLNDTDGLVLFVTGLLLIFFVLRPLLKTASGGGATSATRRPRRLASRSIRAGPSRASG